MVIIKGKEYAPKISNSVVHRFCSSKGIGIARMNTLLEDITSDNLVGVFVFAQNLTPVKITEQDAWDEFDDRTEFLEELLTYINSQLVPNLPDDGKKKSKAK